MKERSGRRARLEIVDDDEERSFAIAVGEAIRTARLAREWTQAMLADEAQLSPNYVARLERGELGPSLWVAHRICRALGMPIGEMLTKHVPVPPLRRRVAVR